jgi:hypothetical protein
MQDGAYERDIIGLNRKYATRIPIKDFIVVISYLITFRAIVLYSEFFTSIESVRDGIQVDDFHSRRICLSIGRANHDIIWLNIA